MLKIQPPQYLHCPFCGRKLSVCREDNQSRKFCKQCNWTYRPHVAGAAIGIVIKKRKVLLVERAQDPFRGKWVFPGGFIRYGEHPTDTLKREMLEETGLRVKHMQLLDIIQSKDDPRSSGHFIFVYKVQCGNGRGEKWDHRENSSVEWFDIKKLPPMGFKVHREAVKRFLYRISS